MKKLLLLTIMMFLFFTGCITDPEKKNEENTIYIKLEGDSYKVEVRKAYKNTLIIKDEIIAETSYLKGNKLTIPFKEGDYFKITFIKAEHSILKYYVNDSPGCYIDSGKTEENIYIKK